MDWSKSVRLLNKSTEEKNGLKFIKEENKAICKKSLGLKDICKYCNRLGWSKSAHQNNSEGALWSNKNSSKDDKYLDSSVDKAFPLFSLHVWRMSYSHIWYRRNFNFSTGKEKGFICVIRCQGKNNLSCYAFFCEGNRYHLSLVKETGYRCHAWLAQGLAAIQAHG